jgi:tRNA(His) 5'-end guanylyltransferase
MRFDELDAQMRVFETAHDQCVLPGLFMVARLDGRNFTRLTKEIHQFEVPFDVRFRDLMLDVAEHLMVGCGISFAYGYAQSDEISLLFEPSESAFQRKLRKLNSILAGEASAKFALSLQAQAAFDCRISELPTLDLVVDYFRWRNEDAHRNSMQAHCYWCLRKAGRDIHEATSALSGLSTVDKNNLLIRYGINFNSLPAWQKRGVGLYWESYDRQAIHPKTQEEVSARRRRIRRELELPTQEEYSVFIRELVGDRIDAKARRSGSA